jgi:flagellin
VTTQWSASRLGNLSGKRIIVTGATNGVGLATARSLARAGAQVVAVVGSPERGAGLSELGAQAKQIETHNTFVGKLQDALETGVGNLVDADLAKESAKLQSLQTKQQLGVQALSIANSSTSILLGLFR